MTPGESSTNAGFREFYAPRIAEPSTTPQRQSMPRVAHQQSNRPNDLHKSRGSANRTHSKDDDESAEIGCLGEINNYKAGDEFILLWKWVDEFMDKRRAKKNSSKSHSVNKSTPPQPKPTPSSSREGRQNPRPTIRASPEAVRTQAVDRVDMRKYKAQRHTPWGELLYLYQTWKDQQAKKKVDQPRQGRHEEMAGGEFTERRSEQTRVRSTNGHEPLRTTMSPPDQGSAADPQPDKARKPNPVYNKKRGEVHKHTVKITQLPPVHNSVHLEHTPSNNYRTKPSPVKGRSTRDTRFSDFLHQERKQPPSQKVASSRETQWTYAVPGEDDELARNSHFSSVLDPAKAIKTAKEAEKAKGPKCYICSSSNCHGGYRDNVTNLWVCADCQQKENLGPVECSVCGQPNSPSTGYAENGLWLCYSCRSPTTPKELPPSPKLPRKITSHPKASEDIKHCECDSPCRSIERFNEKRTSLCPDCNKQLTPFPDIDSVTASGLNDPNPHASRASYGVYMSEYDSDHLYSDDLYEPPATKAQARKPIGLGITFEDAKEEEEIFRPTPPLKDSKYFQDSPTLGAMDYNQSYLRKPGAKHPYAPSPASAAKKVSVCSAREPSKAKPSKAQRHHQQPQRLNPTSYPYPSPPSTPTGRHKPRPASSVYPTDEPATDFPYPPPPIPQRYANSRTRRSSSVTPGTLSKAALARAEPVSPRSQSSPPGSADSARAGLKRRSSWYDFWKPVFETKGERGP